MFLRSLFRPVYTAALPSCTSKRLAMVVASARGECGFSTSARLFCEGSDDEEKSDRREVDPSRDRSKVIPVETSMRYLQSKAYQTTYGSEPVWKPYRRNHKGAIPPRKTRKTCIRGKVLQTSNACPICRDEYLVLDYRNTDLLQQFIAPHNGAILSYKKTNLCQMRHRELVVAVEKARDYGLMTFDVPIREYDYSEYYSLEDDPTAVPSQAADGK